MKDDLSQHQIDEILKALDDTLNEGPWDESNFLRVIGKNIAEIREGFVNHLNDNKDKFKTESHLANRVALRSGQQEIYISLYASEGSRLQSWEKLITNLPRHTTSRPIYADEEDAQAIIKTKENKVNEAYVAVYVYQNDLLVIPDDKAPVDKLGKNLLTIKDKTLNLDNISRFVHSSGTYHYTNGRLVKASNKIQD